MAEPEFLKPFVLKTEAREPELHGAVDLYPPDSATGAVPAILFVHGGPLPEQVRPGPRDWPMFRAYGSLAASGGVLGAVVGHRLHTPADYPQAAGDVAAAIELVRADPRVDPERIALWFFSGGSPLLAEWLRAPTPWLRVIAATYPLLGAFPGWPMDERFLPVQAVATAGDLPIVLTRVGLESPPIAALVEEFVTVATAAGANLEIIDVPDGHHSFDILDHTDQSREAVEHAVTRVLALLNA